MNAVEQLISALKTALPGVQVKQLQTALPGDDAGLWFVRHPNSAVEVNLESHDGAFPVLIESSRDDTRVTVNGINEAIAAIRQALALPTQAADDTSVSLENGEVRAWIEQESIHIIARETASNDPVELTADTARRLAEALLHMAGKLDE